jgi:hypothetical protein
MWSWLKRREWPARQEREAPEHVARPPERVVSGKYQLLHKYLEERFANTVVLTFAEVEDLIGSALPDQARSEPEWWASGLSSRTAKPNLFAQTVAFERPA